MKRIRRWAQVKAHYWFSRWPVADALNRSARTCWCDLVDWALAKDKPKAERQRLILDDGADRYRVLNGDATNRCRQEASKVGTCYCAKFRTAEAEKQLKLGPGVIVPSEVTE